MSNERKNEQRVLKRLSYKLGDIVYVKSLGTDIYRDGVLRRKGKPSEVTRVSAEDSKFWRPSTMMLVEYE